MTDRLAFYETVHDNALRFGDVVRGFVAAKPSLEQPIFQMPFSGYRLEVSLPGFCVILSPCCTIGDTLLSLVPLQPVRPAFFSNPYLAQDLTNINRRMMPEQTVPPQVWKQFSPDELEKRLQVGNEYAFVELFVYERHALFPEYQVHRKDGQLLTNYYAIDFRDTFSVVCPQVKSATNAPLEAKQLQLSVATRQELRDKIAAYYARIPAEDRAVLGLV